MFNISLTGINSAQKYLDVTSNNIANAETYGFKYSRAEFADIYSSSVFSNSKTASGYGTYTTTVSQQFTQGSLSGDTGNTLDMAILGTGFFVLSSSNEGTGSNELTYTRNGAFELDSEGYLVTATGEYVMGYEIDEDGNVVNLDLNSVIAIQIPENTGAPQMSTEASIGVQLPANSDVVTLESFDSEDSSTYTASTSQTIYDSLGNTHTLTYYYLNLGYGADVTADGTGGDEDIATWAVIIYVDGEPVDVASVPEVDDGDDAYDGNDDGTCDAISFTVSDINSSDYNNTYYCFIMEFDTSGNMVNMYPPAVYLANSNSAYTSPRTEDEYTDAENEESNGLLNLAMGGGVDSTQLIHIDMTATQYGSTSFTISTTASTDGYAMGYLTGVEVSEDGIIQCTYSNGQVVDLCMIALATFTNEQGLTKVGDTQWKASINSGEASPAQANVGVAGSIKGSNLELSNVDLTAQLVELIVAQRYYQCNAQSLQTQNNVMDAILSI